MSPCGSRRRTERSNPSVELGDSSQVIEDRAAFSSQEPPDDPRLLNTKLVHSCSPYVLHGVCPEAELSEGRLHGLTCVSPRRHASRTSELTGGHRLLLTSKTLPTRYHDQPVRHLGGLPDVICDTVATITPSVE